MGNDFIDEAVFFRFIGGHVEVAVGVAFDDGQWLAGVVCEHFVEAGFGFDDVTSLDFDVGSLAFGSTKWLMDHYFGVW